ncbi:MAG TPA: hypothetical protein VKR29_13310 [Candidatus Binataceae bacterium]|nr:hypothetical protein [Candidatus Binataceae bacterium]
MGEKLLRITLLLAVLFVLTSGHRCDATPVGDVFQLSATDVTIFAPDTDQIIGHGHYTLLHQGGLDIVEGENKYSNGEYDQEQQSVRPSTQGLPPVLVHYTHRYFNADGTTQYDEMLDAASGNAACSRYDSSGPNVRQTVLSNIPLDTYAGATQLMLLVGRLRQNAPDITFHSFNCIPDPHIIAISARRLDEQATWTKYPGNLIKLEMKPDLGKWLNVIVAPFVPKIYGWFDPTDAFNYAGGEFDRYYKGRHVVMVRTHPPDDSLAQH